jgi:triacylglycerol lipase
MRLGRASTIVAVLVAAATLLPTSPAPAASPDQGSVPVPVLLVHGFDGSAESWKVMVSRLLAAGYPRDRVDAISYDSNGSNVAAAARIAAAVDALRARTHSQRVDIVSHSMGAIGSRYYLEKLGGTAHVAAYASLAGVNTGTVLAYGCYLIVSCQEMVPTSPLLDLLNRNFQPAGPTRWAAWWSPCDTVIVPQDHAELPGARNTETACIGHSDLKTDPTVFSQLLHFLRGGAAQPSR